MIVQGLTSNIYYINTPIKVVVTELDSSVEYLELIVTNLNTAGSPEVSKALYFYPRPYEDGGTEYGECVFDLSEVIKGILPINHYGFNTANDEDINCNYLATSLSLIAKDSDGDDVESELLYKTFFRGGSDTRAFPQTSSIGEVLKESELIPYWPGYPVRKFYVGANRKIKGTTNIPTEELEVMRVIGCEPLYVMFANSKGGYSFWYFPSWELEKKPKNTDSFTRRLENTDVNLGFENDHKLVADCKVRREYYNTIKALIESTECYAYNMFGRTWANIEVDNNSFKENNYEDVQDISVKFKVNMKNQPTLTW